MTIDNVFKTLEKSIIYLEIIVYILVFLLIVRAITLMVYNFINYKNMEQWYTSTKNSFNYTISISLSTILFVEILKLFYIKTSHQILIVSGIVILKLIINYFVELDLKMNQIHDTKKN